MKISTVTENRAYQGHYSPFSTYRRLTYESKSAVEGATYLPPPAWLPGDYTSQASGDTISFFGSISLVGLNHMETFLTILLLREGW